MISAPFLSLLELMKKLDTTLLLATSQNAGFLWGFGKAFDSLPDETELTSTAEKSAELDRIARLAAHCVDLGLTASAASARRLLEAESRPKITLGRSRQLWNELHGRLMDELESSALLTIDPAKAQFYSKPNLFGETVAERFPSAIVDIEEAGKCLALGRNTATVFHLMRVMEAGLRTLGVSLGDPKLDANANPTWERILQRGDAELQKTADKRSPEWKAKGDFFTDAIANLRAVKTAWRNPTMHVRSAYDDEKALDIFNAVRGFMRHLATELAE